MPICGCVNHEQICMGESGPVLKISNKKIKKETIEKLRNTGLLGQYCNFVCQKCVAWVEGDYDKVTGTKRKNEDTFAQKVITNIQNGSFSEDEMKNIATALGSSISDSVYNDSVKISDEYLNPDNLINLNVQEWLVNRNPILVQFLTSTAKCSDEDVKKHECIVGAIESVYKARNLKTVSPVSYAKNLIAYYISQSKNVVNLINSSRPAGSYFSLKNWLRDIGTVPIDKKATKEHDSITFFDNSQVLARNWRVNYHYKSRASVITTTTNIVLPSSIQKNPSLSPSQWLYRGDSATSAQIHQYLHHHRSEFSKIRNKFLFDKINSLKQNARFQQGTFEDNITDLLQGRMVNPETRPTDPYTWVPSLHLDPSPDISVGEPIMANPCSYASVEKVLKEINKTNGVSEGDKSWCVIGCDGLPYTLGTKLIQRNIDLQNILLIPGHGHIEMNALKAVFKILWDAGLKDLSKECGFNSPRAQVCAQSCSDHHKAFMLLSIFFETTLKEIITTYLKSSNDKFSQCTVANLFIYINESKDKNFRFMCDIVINYILPIIIYRAGIRRNNFKYISAGKSQFMKLFFASGMTKYQSLILNDIKTYILAPEEVKEFLQKTQSFTVSGHPSKGEGGDFILEAINGRIKKWLPHGIPEEKHWKEVCRNSDLLQKISEKVLHDTDGNKDSKIYERSITVEVEKYRQRIRKLEYLSNLGTIENAHTSVTGELLDRDLHAFETQIEANLKAYIEKGDKADFTPVFTTELQRTTFYSIERKTKKQLSDIIQEGITQVQENGDIDEAIVLQNMWMKVKTRPKSEMLHFYKEVVAAIENSTGNISSDDECTENDD